ncbi:hypothetical protein [Pseudomonas umsongensis]|uniref:Uncharacterized protein n=1 Tax=Pseudomonas umsongensis TaxID=198618 RepID=A0AAE7DH33_9PSED|nr:hypothetical protein [Pseudomonas umsongensis]QJC81570.1 hypothetical protein HGP31_25940 [Pseudomonas umsongensis]
MVREYLKKQEESDEILLSRVSTISSIINSETELTFWTCHETRQTFVDLTEFKEGYIGKRKSSGSFLGRPELILQLAPSIKKVMKDYSSFSVDSALMCLRSWYRIFDTVEALLSISSDEPIRPLRDISELNVVHYDAAYRTLSPDTFRWFLRVVNNTLEASGRAKLYWDTPPEKDVVRSLPDEKKIFLLRIALKQEWAKVEVRWADQDQVKLDGFRPTTPAQADGLAAFVFMSQAQRLTGDYVPDSPHVQSVLPWLIRDNRVSDGLHMRKLWELNFPNHWDILTAFHMCLATTGWNVSVLNSLDSSKESDWLYDHPSDPNRYVLVGHKVRSNEKAMPVIGLWKTSFGPGAVIKKVIGQTRPLRDQLKLSLISAEKKLTSMVMSKQAHSSVDLKDQYELVQKLTEGTRSVWLYVNKLGAISWPSRNSTTAMSALAKSKVNYLDVLIPKINTELLLGGHDSIPRVVASDFRDMFAQYVWESSGGNILPVMRALVHKRLSTTQRYIDNNISNVERDAQLLSFLNTFFVQLSEGRIDTTLLAYQNRFGAVPEAEVEILKQFRSLERSRLSVACKDPKSPPISTQTVGKSRCSSQRCLICPENAIILPESLHGIAMRAEELVAIKLTIPYEAWSTSNFDIEMENVELALSIFNVADVLSSRNYWQEKIAAGQHIVPGL